MKMQKATMFVLKNIVEKSGLTFDKFLSKYNVETGIELDFTKYTADFQSMIDLNEKEAIEKF